MHALLGAAAALTLAFPPAALAGVILHESFDIVDPQTGLPPGWVKGPPAAASTFETFVDRAVHGQAPPSIRVEAQPVTLHYRLATPSVALPSMDADYTVSFSVRVSQPDALFEVDVIYQDAAGVWTGRQGLVALPGADMAAMRTFRASFNPGKGPQSGRCWIGFGLPYCRILRAGSFWVDDVEIREGREAGNLAFYLRPWSVQAGDAVEVHASATSPTARVEVRHESDRSRLVWAGTLERLHEQPVPAEAWRVGCLWPVSGVIPVGEDWPSGAYTVTIDDGDRSVWESLIVSGKGWEGPLLVVIPTHTDQAYNRWGGRNFYGNPRSREVSFERPTAHAYKGFYHVPVHLIRWLSREGIGFGVISDHDLHHRGDLLSRYAAVVLTWHSEYWTGRMRANMERYLDGGGSLLCFSGNTCWLQTRLVAADDPVEPGSSERLICYKSDAELDPYQAIDTTLVTGLWDEPPLERGPERLHALNWRYGGMVNWSSRSDVPGEYDWLDGHGGYRATNTDHWVYAGTGVAEGNTVGRAQAIVGYEVDGAPLEFEERVPRLAWPDPVPGDPHVLGWTECWNYYHADPGVACMVAFDHPGGGIVFNGGTTGWCWGLHADPVIQRMTRNLIEAALLREVPPAAAIVRAVPTPASDLVRLEVQTPRLPDAIGVYGPDGRRVTLVPVRVTGNGRGIALWDLRDRRGRALAPGVYHVDAGGETTGRIVVLR